MHPYIKPVYDAFTKQSNKKNAIGMKAYMLHQFNFFGIKTPLRDSIVKAHIKSHPLQDMNEIESIVIALWQMPNRELAYFAIDVFAANKKLWTPASIQLIEYCISSKSWWETVDGIASEWLGPYFKLFPEQILPITHKWNHSENIWLQRSSLLFQKSYKNETDTTLLSTYILHLKDSKEFFIKKAIGWVLREYSKTNAEWVIHFVATNSLSALSKKEALKRIHAKPFS
jgi:3-methyladenine DNA glycosylase AlkD